MLARVVAYLRGLARRRAIDAEVDDELRFHVEQEIEALVGQGMSRAEARRVAVRDLGGLAQTREAVRAVRTTRVDILAQDVRYALRTLRRSPGFTAVAVLTLALGIGADTAIFSVINAVVLRPLPYSDHGSLVLVEPSALLTPDWLTRAWRERAETLRDFAGFNGPRAGTLLAGADPEQVDVAQVTSNFFSFLGVPPAIGRQFNESDAAAQGVAMLSHDYWARRFGRATEILGTTITAGGERLTIVGVAGPAFRFPAAGALPASGLLIHTQPEIFRVAPAGTWLNVIGRLAPGATSASARSELLGIFKQEGATRFSRRFLDSADLKVTPLQDRLVGDVRQRLWLVMGAVSIVLLVACANLANLLLARASTRQRELAVRSALGAGAGRLARLLVTEGLVLSGAGSIFALLLTYWLRGSAGTLFVGSVPHVGTIAIDWSVLSFNAVIATITGLLCGLVPLPGIMRVDLAAIFNSATSPGITGQSRTRRVLLATEIALTFVLLVAGALMARTLWNLNHKERGFNADRVLTVRVSPGLPPALDRTKPGTGQTYFAEFFSDLTRRIGTLPGVVSVAAASIVPLAGPSVGLSSLAIDGRTPSLRPDETATSVSSVTPAYFETMGTRVIAGRDFDDGDRMGSALVAIVNEAFPARFAPGGNLLGSRVTYDKRTLTIVGVVADVPDRSLRLAARPMLFTPVAQMPAGPFGWGQMALVLRTADRDARSLSGALRHEIWRVDRNIVVDEISTMDERVAGSLRSERQSAFVLGLFALAALLMATIGVYAVAAYTMARRTKEIGIRIAMGATRRHVRVLVISHVIRPTACGIGFGAAGAVFVTRVVSSRLYGVSALDPLSFAATAILLASVTLVASYLPVRRAMSIDPLVTLRSE